MKAIYFFSFYLVASVIAAPAAPATSLPQYQFQVGQELRYEGSSNFQHENGAHRTEEKRTFWITRQNKDGSWHVVAQREHGFSQSFKRENMSGSPPRKQRSFGAFDLFPDGRMINVPKGFEEQGLTEPFFKLPADLAAARAGWKEEEAGEESRLYRLVKEVESGKDLWIFERTDQGLFKDVYSINVTTKIFFDAERGLIAKRESENSQDYGFKGKGTGRTELASSKQCDPEWIAQLDRESEILVQAKEEMRRVMESFRRKPKGEQDLQAAKQILADSRTKVTLPEIRAQFDAQIESFEQSSKYYLEDKEREETVLNKPAAEWETTDLEGKTHSLVGYRGKVVVLDFWYRGCGWCIRAMPQIKQISDDFRDKPVAILGMNTDQSDKDAQFVVDKLKLNYPTLHGTGIPERYGVQGFPTLIVIDREGIVRARHVGYAPDLREEVGKIISGLLVAAADK